MSLKSLTNFSISDKYDFEFIPLSSGFRTKGNKAMIPLYSEQRPGGVLLNGSKKRGQDCGRPCRVVLVKSRQWGRSDTHCCIHVLDDAHALQELAYHNP